MPTKKKLNFEKGTLWWVKEERWKKGFRETNQKYDWHSTRDKHPGVSTLESSITASLNPNQQPIPLLYGRTNEPFPQQLAFSFPVSRVSRDYSEIDRETWFGLGFQSIPVEQKEFVDSKFFTDDQHVARNLDKVILTNHEKELMDEAIEKLLKRLESQIR